MYEIIYLTASTALLGQSPIWHPQFQRFYWVDSAGETLINLDPVDYNTMMIQLSREDNEEEPRAVAIAPQREGFVVAMEDHIGTLNLDGSIRIAPAEGLEALTDPNVKFSDAKCSPNKDLYVGTMDVRAIPKPVQETSEAISQVQWLTRAAPFHNTMERNLFLDTYVYRVTNGKAIKQSAIGHPFVSSGATWSLDGRKFYFVCPTENKIKEFDYDPETGDVYGPPRLVRDVFSRGMAYGGSTIDDEGYLWFAIINGGRVIRVDPLTGDVVQEISIGIKNPTHLAFGGEDYRTLLVTQLMEDPYEAGYNNMADRAAVINFTEESGIRGVKPDLCSNLYTR